MIAVECGVTGLPKREIGRVRKRHQQLSQNATRPSAKYESWLMPSGIRYYVWYRFFVNPASDKVYIFSGERKIHSVGNIVSDGLEIYSYKDTTGAGDGGDSNSTVFKKGAVCGGYGDANSVAFRRSTGGGIVNGRLMQSVKMPLIGGCVGSGRHVVSIKNRSLGGCVFYGTNASRVVKIIHSIGGAICSGHHTITRKEAYLSKGGGTVYGSHTESYFITPTIYVSLSPTNLYVDTTSIIITSSTSNASSITLTDDSISSFTINGNVLTGITATLGSPATVTASQAATGVYHAAHTHYPVTVYKGSLITTLLYDSIPTVSIVGPISLMYGQYLYSHLDITFTRRNNVQPNISPSSKTYQVYNNTGTYLYDLNSNTFLGVDYPFVIIKAVATMDDGTVLNYDTLVNVNLSNQLTIYLVKATLRIIANNDTMAYDTTYYDGDNGFTYLGLVSGESESNSDVIGTVSFDIYSLDGTLLPSGAKEVGRYYIRPKGLTSDNYAIVYDDGILTITGSTATITFTDIEKSYTGQVQYPSYTTNPAGLVPTWSAAYSDVGVYHLTATLVGSYVFMSNTLFTITPIVTQNDIYVVYNKYPYTAPIVVDPTYINTYPYTQYTYNDLSTAPTDCGTYNVEATIDYKNFIDRYYYVLKIAKSGQNISFNLITRPITVGDTGTIVDIQRGESGLPYSITSVFNKLVINGSTWTAVALGAEKIEMVQTGNNNWEEVSFALSFTVREKLSFSYLGNNQVKIWGGTPYSNGYGFVSRDGLMKNVNIQQVYANGYGVITISQLGGSQGWCAETYAGITYKDSLGTEIFIPFDSGFKPPSPYWSLYAGGSYSTSGEFYGTDSAIFTIGEFDYLCYYVRAQVINNTCYGTLGGVDIDPGSGWCCYRIDVGWCT